MHKLILDFHRPGKLLELWGCVCAERFASIELFSSRVFGDEVRFVPDEGNEISILLTVEIPYLTSITVGDHSFMYSKETVFESIVIA